MQTPPIPADESLRLAALHSLCLLDTPQEERFDRITRSVARLFDVPIVLVSLVDETRQWFKSRHGLEAPQTHRDVSFCGWAILGDDPFVVEDALADPRFADNPLVQEEPRIRFYAGMPLRGPGGKKIGTLCLIDREPRVFDRSAMGQLRDVAAWAEREINEATLRTALQQAADGEAFFQLIPEKAFIATPEGRVLKANPVLRAARGLDETEFERYRFRDWVHAGDVAKVDQAQRDLAEHGVLHGLEARTIEADGRLAWTQWEVRAHDGRIYGVGRDITELKQARLELEASEARFRELTDLSPDIVARHSLDGRFTFVSSALHRVLGLDPEVVLGRMPTDFVLREDRQAMQTFFTALVGGDHPSPAQFRASHAQGGTVWLEARGTLVLDASGTALEAVVTSRDITDIKALEALLTREATRDELTGLNNRRYLKERLDPAIRSAKRYGHPLSFCLCDLDHFKQVNDTHGHAHGDEVLKVFGLLARKELRSEDLAARYGGDEFAFLFPFISASEAAVCLERVRERIAGRDFGGRDDARFRVTATFGVVDLDPAHATPEDLFEAADQALYRAKADGRDRVRVGA